MPPSILATWSAARARRRPTKPDTANALVETAEAFAEYRTGTGPRAEVVTLADLGFPGMESGRSPIIEAVRARVRAAWEDRDPTDPFYLLLVLDKVRDHEGSYEPGLWNRRLNAYAGTGDFGPEIDAAIELAAQKAFEEIPYDYDIRFAYDNPDSIYYYAPFPQIIQQYLTEGSILTTYMGHGGGEMEGRDLHGLVCLHRCPCWPSSHAGPGTS